MPERHLLTIHQFAELLRVGLSTAQTLAQNAAVPGFKVKRIAFNTHFIRTPAPGLCLWNGEVELAADGLAGASTWA